MSNVLREPQSSVAEFGDADRLAAAADALDYRRFFERSLDMLATAGFDGYLKVVNPAFERFLGQTSAELTGRPYLDFVHPDDIAATLLEAEKLASGIDSGVFENRHRCADGTYRWVRWSAKSVVSDQLLYCVAFDVTERRAQHDIVDKLVTELQRSNADLGQFAYVASHDLSEPLRMVSSYVQLLAHRYQGQLDADADEFIGYAVDGTARMKALIDDLLAYARAGRVVTLSRPVDCAAVLRDVLTDLSGVVSDRNATMIVGDLPVLISDPGLLGQIFQNLLANALKFVKPGVIPEITVSAERVDGVWHFSVKDNGIGIAEQHRERIFMMFKRLHGRNEYPGTGIGLALCERVVGRLDGRIWVDSQPGVGSTFHFTVPASEPAATEGH
jgi:PAS domain S-box-containing protein